MCPHSEMSGGGVNPFCFQQFTHGGIFLPAWGGKPAFLFYILLLLFLALGQRSTWVGSLLTAPCSAEERERCRRGTQSLAQENPAQSHIGSPTALHEHLGADLGNIPKQLGEVASWDFPAYICRGESFPTESLRCISSSLGTTQHRPGQSPKETL